MFLNATHFRYNIMSTHFHYLRNKILPYRVIVEIRMFYRSQVNNLLQARDVSDLPSAIVQYCCISEKVHTDHVS